MNISSQTARRHLGKRVRAVTDIDYVDAGITIEKGREGAIQLVTGGGALVGMRWDRDADVVRSTFLDFVELVDEAQP